MLAWVEAVSEGRDLLAAGHRIVHGGPDFREPRRLDDAAVAALDALSPLAPLHQPQSLEAVLILARLKPGLVQVGCFDTAFHATQPSVASRFGLPRAMHDRGLRRYGFHGLSYQNLVDRLEAAAPDLARGRVIAAHLGSGASLCAIKAGRSLDSTMGFSPLDGLLMSTRPGSLDPGLVLYLRDHEGLGAEAMQDLLYHRSGLLGVSGQSSDMRELLASPSPEAAEAVELFVYRIGRDAGALAGVLGGLDGVVFTGGIGENSPEIRTRVAAWIVPADEERVIARLTFRLIQEPDGAASPAV